MVDATQTVQIVQVKEDTKVERSVQPVSLVKWAGGKERELRYILPRIPQFQHYYDPFVGGGAVFFSIPYEKRKYINDKSFELITLYRMVAANDQCFYDSVSTLLRKWVYISELATTSATKLMRYYDAYALDRFSNDELVNVIAEFVSSHAEGFKENLGWPFDRKVENFIRGIESNLFRKLARMKSLENKKGKLPVPDVLANIEGAMKSAFYGYVRHMYNHVDDYEIPLSCTSAIFFFVRENAYASMFRYNSNGEFNVPYGGITYNRKDLAKKIASMQSVQVRRHFTHTLIENRDFEHFFQLHTPGPDDFVFLDPPYDSEFSTYSRNEFSRDDQARLAHYLLNHCKAKFMLVIKKTLTITELYANRGLRIHAFSKKYLVNFQDRNNRDSEHLIITNY